ncbi:MAG: exodeoxyribonuclease VII large subunit [Kangiellaceae bacterium]|nr:exodeoxyribonuclease VII large subunit [Kangiellaceae bacterium]
MIKPVLQPQQPPKRTLLSVSQLNRQAKTCLESGIGSVWLTGEISNLTKAGSGHWYFSLKDDNAQVRAAMFRFKTQTLRFSPKEGDQVVVKGKVSLYEARGDYQLIADYMEPAGEGDLQQKLKALMQKLQAEGLFAEEAKRPLPFLPQRIGVITSPTGAAIHDVLTVLNRRCPMVPVIIYPTQVQGAQATEEIKSALFLAQQRKECDVLLLTRGGGSLEDLWCFNDESLARLIAECPIPTVAAIGHEVDITITELVSDLRAATPSAAAELLVPEQQALQQKLDYLSLGLAGGLLAKIQELKNRLGLARLKLSDPATAITHSKYRLAALEHRLQLAIIQALKHQGHNLKSLKLRLENANPAEKLEHNAQKLNALFLRLSRAMDQRLESSSNELAIRASRLNAMSPLSVMSRGYSILRQPETGNIINSVKQLKPSESIELLLTDGNAKAEVTQISNKPIFNKNQES